MRPRQNLRDFHRTTPPISYQPLNHNPNLAQQQQQLQQPMAPPPPPLRHLVNTASTAQSSLPTPDLISELIRLGLNPEDLTKQSNRPARGREDMFKSLQSMLGKRDMAELLQKLRPLNEWPVQPVTPPDFPPKVGIGSGGSSNSGGVCSRDSVICGPNMIVGGSSGASVPSSYTNHVANNGNSSQQEQDIQFNNVQQQATASTINHNQHFRVPTTNTTTLHSPQQHKSVLSIHQQQQQLHNDHTNRRLNQQLNSGTTSNIFASSNDMSRIPTSSSSSISTSSTNSTTLDPHNNNIFNRKTSPPSVPCSATSAGTAPRASNLMESLGSNASGGIVGPTMDDIYNKSAFQQPGSSGRDGLSNQQQSLIRHQQLQKLLRVSAGASKTPLTPNMSSRGGDTLNCQRNLTNANNISHIQRQLTSPLTSTISPPQQTLSSVPKSLLNLAACSTSPPGSNSISSSTSIGKASRNANTNQLSSYNNNNQGHSNTPVPINRTTPRGGSNVGSNNAFNSKAPHGIDSSNLMQQIIARTSQTRTTGLGPINKSIATNQTLTSLLNDDQKNSRGSSAQVHPGQVPLSNVRSSNQNARKQSQNVNEDINASSPNPRTKEAYLAYLQKRAARAGLSIGEISSSTNTGSAHSEVNLQDLTQPRNSLLANDLGDLSSRKDIESALNQVGCRNDLSLLYPPIPIGASSQKQINTLATSLELSNGEEVFTDEIKRIVQDECNVIYECKKCSNLFRSLANLIKHKRVYCNDTIDDEVSLDVNRRVNILTPTMDLSLAKNSGGIEFNSSQDTSGSDSTPNDQCLQQRSVPGSSLGSQKYNLRGSHLDLGSICSDTKSTKAAKCLDRRESKDRSHLVSQDVMGSNIVESGSSKQTNLSRLLQSQPRTMPSTAKDSALMDALNMSATTSKESAINTNSKACSFNQLNEHLVRNSSLAKTLLNEKTRSIGSGHSSGYLTKLDATETPKRISAPKRKILEDCIQKVKRDKLSEDIENPASLIKSSNPSDQPGTSRQQQMSSGSDNLMLDDFGNFKDPLAIEDSGTESDTLVIDLDESHLLDTRKNLSSDGKTNPRGRGRHSGAHSTVSSRLNSSSALLKALTRPVENKPSFTSTSDDDKTLPTNVPSTGLSDDSKSKSELEEELSKTKTGRSDKIENDLQDSDSVCFPPSPLFDKYVCEICDIDLENQQTLLSHTVDTHTDEKKIYPCIFCSFSFITLENVCRHIIDMHKKTKAQVTRLKEVVLSRSFMSSDFASCSDHPAISAVTSTPDCPAVNEPKIKSSSPNSRRDSSTPSDISATQQILEDTIAMVSGASSPQTFTSSQRLAAIMSKAPSKSEESTTPIAEVGVADDPLCESIITSITDEHLAILERQEAEIEAERLKQEQNAALANSAGNSDLKTTMAVSVHDDTSRTESASTDQDLNLRIEKNVASADDISAEFKDDKDDGGVESEKCDDQDSKDDLATESDTATRSSRARDSRSLKDSSAKLRYKDEPDQKDVAIVNIVEYGPDVVKDQNIPSKTKHLVANQSLENEQQDSGEDERYQEELNPDEDVYDASEAADVDRESQAGTSDVQANLSSNDDESISSGSSGNSDSESDSNESDPDSDGDTSEASIDDEDMQDNDEGQHSLRVSPKRRDAVGRTSHGASSSRSDADPHPGQSGGKVTPYSDYQEGASSSRDSHKHSNRSADNRSKTKNASRVCGSTTTPSGTGSISNSAGSSGSGGGIMKLKIQLKTQPDEKSKVYRIVD